MTPRPDDFEDLRRLLRLKRYERPPPGYFDELATQVQRRLEAGEAFQRMDLVEHLSLEARWLVRLWEALVARPLALGSVGAGLAVALLAGLFYLLGRDLTPSEPPQSAAAAPPAQFVSYQPSLTPIPVAPTNPIPGFGTPPSLFDRILVETRPAQAYPAGAR